MIEQSELTGDRLAHEILSLVGNKVERTRMSLAAARLSKPHAATAIVDKVLELAT